MVEKNCGADIYRGNKVRSGYTNKNIGRVEVFISKTKTQQCSSTRRFDCWTS
jgi:hypothetical protein